ncbi:MAG: hypothetical protein OEM82_11695 [Acidobacteriota bacterium]|nr:hypothetical protein [Acidobacteriota bacterium]MDH3531004.1 hypothetical protein [Acidobacteriota bacterium]
MRRILRIASVIVIGIVFMGVNANAQGALSRDFSEVCQDTFSRVAPGVFEGGHYAGMPNLTTEGDGYQAVVSRDDRNASQGLWDCSNDIVSGSITERLAPGQGFTLRHAVLNYQLPLEVWTWVNNAPGVKVVDNGVYEATLTSKQVIAYQGAPLSMNCVLAPQPCGTYFAQVSGHGIAFGTGAGEFYEGQMVRVKVTQTFMFQRNRPDMEFPNWDGLPVENIILTPIN